MADYDDPATLDSAFQGAEAVLLVSGNEFGRRVPQHTAVIDATARIGARIVYTSITKATTTSLILAPEHKATEEAITAAGAPAVILRNGWYHENYARAISDLASTGTTVASSGAGRIASAARNDYAEAAAVALTDTSLVGTIHELAGDVAWTMDELAKIVSEVAGRPASVIHVDPQEHARSLSAAGLPEDAVGLLVGLDANTAEGLIGETDGSLARLIGHATTPIRAYVESLV